MKSVEVLWYQVNALHVAVDSPRTCMTVNVFQTAPQFCVVVLFSVLFRVEFLLFYAC
jgi:hypothetical protein